MLQLQSGSGQPSGHTGVNLIACHDDFTSRPEQNLMTLFDCPATIKKSERKTESLQNKSPPEELLNGTVKQSQ